MAEPLWTMGEIVAATGGSCLGAHTTPVSGLSIDSRSLAAGEGFVAIRGPNRDGHSFRRRRACVRRLLRHRRSRAFPSGDEERLVRVDDTLEALNALGAGRRALARPTRW